MSLPAPSKEPLHLDNAAGSVCDPLSVEAFSEAAKTFFANQEGSGLSSGRAAEAVSAAAKELSLALVNASSQDVLWVNSGTEALVAAVEGACAFRQGGIISTDVEHPALFCALDRAAEAQGAKVKRAHVGPDGLLDLWHLESLVDDKTSLVAVHHVHSETGTVQNLEAIRAILDRKAPKALLLADTTQAALKLPLPWQQARLDFATISGLKVGAPCGAALLYREDDRRMLGKRLRSLRNAEHKIGRCPAAACIALASTAKRLSSSLSARLENMRKVKDAFKGELEATLGDKVSFTVPDPLASPYLLHLLISGIQGATIVRMLSEKGFSVAAGSACDAEARSPSKTLLAMGIPRVEAYSAIRLSFWTGEEGQHAKAFAEALAQAVKDY